MIFKIILDVANMAFMSGPLFKIANEFSRVYAGL